MSADISEKQQQPPLYPNQGHPANQGYPANQGPIANQGYPGNLPPTVVNVVPVPQSVAMTGQQYRDQLFTLCAQGQHERKTEYGVCGIITAIALFPFGLICLFLDINVKCSRCGVSLPK